MFPERERERGRKKEGEGESGARRGDGGRSIFARAKQEPWGERFCRPPLPAI